MTDTVRLEKAIDTSGLKKGHIADKLGLSRYGLLKKIRGQNEFTASEIAVLADVLGLTKAERDSIFFAKCVDDPST